MFDEYLTEDADIVLVAYGISSRVCRTAVESCREKGYKAGLLRPQTLFPFPSARIAQLADRGAKGFFAVECSNGQMVRDVRLALNGKAPVEFYGRMGGEVPSAEEVVEKYELLFGGRR